MPRDTSRPKSQWSVPEERLGGIEIAQDRDESFGGALQAGIDYRLNERWFLNADVKKVWINTDVSIDAGGLGTVTGDVDIDPVIFGLGIGLRY